MSSPSPSVPKAALYYYPKSNWCIVALLTLAEKGYGDDEVDLKVVDLLKGENYSPAFLRLNPKATVPTLVAPLAKSLQPDMEVRYKALTESTAIAEFLDKSRSTFSHTHTTSSAPAPSLAPATMAFSTISQTIIEILHSAADPTVFARNDEELKLVAERRLGLLQGRHDALTHQLSESEKDSFRVSEKTKTFWKEKLETVDAALAPLRDASKTSAELSAEAKEKREAHYAQGVKTWDNLKIVLETLSNELIGPYALGDQVCVADLHIGPWFARLAKACGGTGSDSGSELVAKIEQRLGGFSLPKDFAYSDPQRTPGVGAETETTKMAKLAAFYDSFKERPSWKKYYGDSLL